MDIWLWVDDWWSWIAIYLAGGFTTAKALTKRWGEWVIEGESLEFVAKGKREDDLTIGVPLSSVFWPVTATVFAIVFLGNFSRPKPPKELKAQVQEKKLDRLLNE